MTDLPWLTILMVVPLLGALLVAALPARTRLARPVALAVSLLTLAIGVAAAVTSFDRGSQSQFQLTERHEWIPQFGVSYALGVDGISLALILMSLVLAPVCILAAWDDESGHGVGDQSGEAAAGAGRHARGLGGSTAIGSSVDSAAGEPTGDPSREKVYLALLLSLIPFMVGVFAATDVFLFYVFFEAMLIPVYFLIGMFGGPRRQQAAVKFLLYSLAGGLIMLVGVIGLYLQGPGGSDGFLVERLTGLQMDQGVARWLFLAFFIAFAIKAPMWPVHTWLPDAAAQSRPAVATLLVGVLDKVGTYGMIRFCLQMFPEASAWATPVIIVLAVISVIYGAILAIGQADIMRLIAFTSISHFGFIVMGIFALTSASQSGSNLYMINHGFSTAALFLIAGMLVARRGSARIDDFGGWQRVTPALAGVFFIAGLSALSLPGLSSFVSEFLVVVGTYQRYPLATIVSVGGVVLAALYVLLAYKRMMTGPAPVLPGAEGPVERDAGGEMAKGSTAVEAKQDLAVPGRGGDLPPIRHDLDEGRTAGCLSRPVRDLTLREKLVVAPLIASFLLLGFYPKPVLDLLAPAVQRTMHQVGVSDPAPTSPAGSTAGTTSEGDH